jgi:hypothetical protein
MDEEFRRIRNSVLAIVAAIFLMAATVTALLIVVGPDETQMAGNDQPAAGSSGIARPHPPLDRAPGEPLKSPL